MLNFCQCVITFCMVCLPFFSTAQQAHSDTRTWQEKVGVGGNVGLRFGDITYVEASPVAGYRLTSFLMPGVGMSYRYISYRYSNYGRYSNHVYGGSVWMRAYVASMVFGYAEYEVLNGEWDPLWQPDIRYNITTTFIGGGYSQESGRTSSY